MGIKGDKKANNSNSDQARLARLTLEGNSGSEEDMQLMIKTIIETTGCTQSQAEIALLDSDNNLYGAIDHILEAGDKLDSWTEQKGPKKEKKKSDEGGSFNSRSYVARGRGGGTGFVDRGGRGRSNGAPRESRESREPRESRDNRDNNREKYSDNRENKEGGGAGHRPTRGGYERPYVGRGGRGGGSRGGYSRAVAPSSTIEPDAFTADLDDAATKVDTTVTEALPPVEESVTATVPTSSAPAPISFAAVAAAAHRKEALRKQQAQNPQPAAPPRRSLSPQPPLPSSAAAPVKEEPAPAVFSEPETSHQAEDDVFVQSESSALAEEQTPNVSTHHDENVQSSPPEQTNQALTTQLKTDLGIGMQEAGATPILSSAPAPAQTIPDPGVEFVGTTAPTNVHDYSFGFVEAPPSSQIPAAETSAASISTNSKDLFNSPRMMPKQVEPERTIPNGDYNLKSASPPLSYGQPNRGLSYDTSSASYPPTDRLVSNKSQFNNPGQLPSQQSSQPLQQQQPQQPTQPRHPTPPAQAPQPGHPHPQHMLFTPQMPYGYMNSYMNMYSPMPGVRDDQYAALMQYGMGVDLSNLSTILPQTGALSQSASAQQVQSGQQRETHGGLMDFNKFGSQSSRDQQPQQPSNVGPPPGFQAAANYMQQPNLSSLFMQQPYPAAPHTFGFMNMMPNVGSNAGGRQMYGQDDERKNYDKMAGSKPTTQQNQHSQYQHNGGNLGKYGNSMNNKPPYNWGN